MFNFQGSVRCVVTALILYHIHSSLSSTFWKYFLFSFYLIFFSFEMQLLYYITSLCFCQVLFQNFLKFFKFLILSFKTQLLYYITSFRLCQVIFQTFLKLFVLSSVFRGFPRWQLYYITTFQTLCQYIFRHFSKYVKSILYFSILCIYFSQF